MIQTKCCTLAIGRLWKGLNEFAITYLSKNEERGGGAMICTMIGGPYRLPCPTVPPALAGAAQLRASVNTNCCCYWYVYVLPNVRRTPTSTKSCKEARGQLSKYTLQMKGWWESNIKVWFPFMYSQKLNCYFQNIIIMFCLQIPTIIQYICERFIYFQDRSA